MAWVDAAKGMSILLVVAHHAVSFLHTSGLAPPAVVVANTALASMRMPLFFLVSGLFVAGPLAASWRTLLHKRVAFFLHLFVAWTVLRFAFFHTPAVAAVDPYVDDTDVGALALALVIPGSGMWFIYALALFAVIAKLVRGVPMSLQLGVAGVLSAVVGADLLHLESDVWARMARHLFFFLLGWHARTLVERVARAATALRVTAAAAACVACAAAAVVLGIRWIPGVALGLNVLAVTFGVLFAAWISRYRLGRPLVALGAQTLPVYLIHIFWIAVVMVGLQHVDVPPAAAYALPAVLAVGCTLLSLLTHRVLVAGGATWLFTLPSRLAYRAPAPVTA
ncbi:hypothetical protein GCM10023320_06310 [Pseudonocardia adelaidensis]|uniref:Acyltransferase 3 domain-containing protein n=2 Tax=Pseudonocardia adelaidensis TaxID=648754 RepID=A0ABP9NCH3_9PSEU